MIRWRRQLGGVVAAGALAVLGSALPTATASAASHHRSPNETLTFSVPTATVLKVEHLMALSHNTTKLGLIWADALCDAPAEPIPRQTRTTPKASSFSVTIARTRVATLARTLPQYGCTTLLKDYQTSLGRFEERLAHESSEAGGAGVTTTSS